jgi:hypothetical protein
VDCKFIKLPYDLTPVDLIPPTYQQSIQPNIPTPTGTTYQHLFYSDTSTLLMCNETAPIYPYWSNCSTISAGCSLYTTSGATTYVSEGTLVKETGGNSIYQIIEYGILTNLTTC